MRLTSPSLTVGRASHPGQRRQNQDWLGYLMPRSGQSRAKGAIFVVADGFGAEGLWASRMAVETLIGEYYRCPSPAVEWCLVWAVQRANARVHARWPGQMVQAGSGTTLTAAVVRGSDLYVANVGDSRAYLLRGGHAQQMTRDHNFAAEEVARGALSPLEARRHPWRHLLTRFVGVKSGVAVDVFRQRMRHGDVLVLCTDGLTEQVMGRELPRFDGARRADEMASLLVRVALRRGADDNATSLVVQVDGTARQGESPRAYRSHPAAPGSDAAASFLSLVSGVAAAGVLLVLLMSLLAGARP